MNKTVLYRRSSVPELNNRLLRRPKLERKITAPALLETTEKRSEVSCNHKREFEKIASELKLPEIATLQQGMVTTAWKEDAKTRSCGNDESLKLDVIVPKKPLRRRECLLNSFCLNTKLCINSPSQREAYDRSVKSECPPLPKASSYYQRKSKALQQFIENGGKSYDCHKEKAILLYNWILCQASLPSSGD